MLDKPKFCRIVLMPVLYCSLLLISPNVFAQIKIDTDRPDQTESVFTIPQKFIQIEMGFINQKENNYFSTYTIPTALLKYGITKNTELRVIGELNFSNDKLFTENDTKKNTVLQLGFKTALLEEKGLLPKTAFIAHTSLQNVTTDDEVSKKNIGLNYRFTCQHTLTKNIALGYNIGMEWEDFNTAPAYVYTISTGFNIGQKWYAYIESFGTIYTNNSPENSADAGFAYYINNNFKLDISGGIGISNAAPKNYGAVGFSYRFNTGK